MKKFTLSNKKLEILKTRTCHHKPDSFPRLKDISDENGGGSKYDFYIVLYNEMY